MEFDNDFLSNTGTSRERRDKLKKETLNLGKVLPFKFDKTSQLRILKAACTYLKKEKHFFDLKSRLSSFGAGHSNEYASYNQLLFNQELNGFVICFSRKGELVYISDNVSDFLGFNMIDILLTYDFVYEMTCDQDKKIYKYLEEDFSKFTKGNRFAFYTSWFVSKIKRKYISIAEFKQFRMIGHYDTQTNMFIAKCEPVLSTFNREILMQKDPNCFTTMHKLNLQILDCSSNASSLVGYSLEELQEKSSLYEILSNESVDIICKRHRDLLNAKNTKGYLEWIKLIHKNEGYLNCLVNIFYDNKGYIICNYQIISHEDMLVYQDYVSGLDQIGLANVTDTSIDGVGSDYENEFDDNYEKTQDLEGATGKKLKRKHAWDHDAETIQPKPRKSKKKKTSLDIKNEETILITPEISNNNFFANIPNTVDSNESHEINEIDSIKESLKKEILSINSSLFDQQIFTSSAPLEIPTAKVDFYLEDALNDQSSVNSVSAAFGLDYEDEQIDESKLKNIVFADEFNNDNFAIQNHQYDANEKHAESPLKNFNNNNNINNYENTFDNNNNVNNMYNYNNMEMSSFENNFSYAIDNFLQEESYLIYDDLVN